VRQPVADTQLFHQVVEPLLVHLGARERSRQGDVLGRGQRRDEVEGLEDEADPVTSQLGEPGIIKGPDILLAHECLPRRRPVQARHAMHQRRLARARRPHDGREPAALDGHADTGQGMHGCLSDPVRLAQVYGMRRRSGLHAIDRCLRLEHHADFLTSPTKPPKQGPGR
jgi:hypothetical protein